LEREVKKLQGQSLTISCTHAGEEEALLDAMDSDWFVILVPRHPERFAEVAEVLKTEKYSATFRWSCLEERNGRGAGFASRCDGSAADLLFVESSGHCGGQLCRSIGGHNVLEPCLYGTPVIFGPYTHAQTELTSRAIESGAGARVPVEQLRAFIHALPLEGGRHEACRCASDPKWSRSDYPYS